MIRGEPGARIHAAQASLLTGAAFARDTAMAITVMLPREPGVVAQARAAAQAAGVSVAVDVSANTISVRFAASPDAPG